MKHISPDEFMTKGQANAMRLAERIEQAEHFNMFFWVRPGAGECPSCMGGYAADLMGANIRNLEWTEIRDLAAGFLGFDREQASLAFTPPWVREIGAGPCPDHIPEHAARAVALLRHYAATGVVTWNARRQYAPAVMAIGPAGAAALTPAWL